MKRVVLYTVLGFILAGCAREADMTRVAEDEGYGTLDLGGVTFSAAEEVAGLTRAAEASGTREAAPGMTRAVDASDFEVKIWRQRREGEELVEGLPATVAGFAAPVTLPVADYRIEVRSAGEAQAAAFDAPWYVGEVEFSILRDQTVSPEVVCRQANGRVTVRYGFSLIEEFWNPAAVSTSVTMGENSLEFPFGELRGGYLWVTEPTEVNVVFTGEVSGNFTQIDQTVTVSPGGWTRVRLVLENDESFPIIVVDNDENGAGQIGDGESW
ncbi:MAG: DUF4493 domain-containing protein [Alistipes sp.]|jgi:hypothetical protein|nr:DUF4493 domain-containing protein [Alistipes sp.]